jgi:hypothetical protein
MSENIFRINDLQLPSELLLAIESGKWAAPSDIGRWSRLFPASEIVRPELYSASQIKIENTDWYCESDPIYLGRADNVCEPGDLDPRRSLLIGEMQPDAMIALDYRRSLDRPAVVYFMPFDDGYCRWILVAPDIETFIDALSLNGKSEVH